MPVKAKEKSEEKEVKMKATKSAKKADDKKRVKKTFCGTACCIRKKYRYNYNEICKRLQPEQSEGCHKKAG